MASNKAVLSGLLILLCFKTGIAARLSNLFERIDELEIELIKERIERRKELKNLHENFEKIESCFNESDSEVSSTMSIHFLRSKYEEMKNKLEHTNLKEITDASQLLRRGFQEEKKQNLRLRRRVLQVESILSILLSKSENTTTNMFSLSETLQMINESLLKMSDNVFAAKLTLDRAASRTNMMERALHNISATVSGVPLFHRKLTNIEENFAEHFREIKEMQRQDTSFMKLMLQMSTEMKDIKDTLTSLVYLSIRPVSCKQLRQYRSGVYYIYFRNSRQLLKVYCDQDTDGGGWIVFQRRRDGSIDFNRDWQDYKDGFGSLDGEFWLGNDNIHWLLAGHSNNELRVDLEDFDGNKAYAKYSTFNVDPESENYALTADGYSGNAGDSLKYHSGQKFSTRDRDNDNSEKSCSHLYRGAWWYKKCHDSNLNGLYTTNSSNIQGQNVVWYRWKNNNYPMKFTEMKFRELD